MDSAHPSMASISPHPHTEPTSYDERDKAGPVHNVLKKPTAPKFQFNLQEKTLEEVSSEVSRRLLLLTELDTKVYETSECSNDLVYLKEASKYGERGPSRLAIYDMYVREGAADLFSRIWKQNFPLDFTKRKAVFDNMKNIMIVLWNGTDMSVTLVKKVIEMKLYEEIFGYLTDDKFQPPGAIKNQFTKYLLKGCMGILNNCVQNYDCRELFREKNAVNIFLALKDVKDDLVAIKSLMILSYLINEEENEKMHSNDNHFAFFVKLLEDSLKYDDHHSVRYGFSAIEIVESLNRLASNDNNKERLVQNSVLPLYIKMMDTEKFSAKENASAARGLWTLAFKCSAEIASAEGCIEGLQILASTSRDKDSKKQANGALWILAENGFGHKKMNLFDDLGGYATEQQLAPQPPPPSAPTHLISLAVDQCFSEDQPPLIDFGETLAGKKATSQSADSAFSTSNDDNQDVPHVFISYNWGSKPIVLQIKEKLKQQGYKVWMDVEDMSGSILEGMALAVEKAAVVIVCFSQKYKESPNCRTEAEYTFKQRKPIIPLRMQFKYIPDGWLGALIGNQLFFDFSKEEKFEGSLQGLLRELGNKGLLNPTRNQDLPDTTNSLITITPEVAPLTSAVPPSVDSGVKTWQTHDVQEWLDKLGINGTSSSLSLLDGGLLLELKFMQSLAPESFYQSLKIDFGLSIIDVLKFTKALKELH